MSCGSCDARDDLSAGATDPWSGHKSLRLSWRQGVKLASAVTSENLRPREEILNRETKGIKLDRNIIIASKRADGDQIFNKRW